LWKSEDFADTSLYDTAPISDLLPYLCQDLKTTAAAIQYMLDSEVYNSKSSSWGHALEVEQEVARLVQEQVETGVSFDKVSGEMLASALMSKKNELEEKLTKVLPIVTIPEKDLHHPPKIQFLKSGKPSAFLEKYCAKYGWTVEKKGGEWRAVNGTYIKKLPLVYPLKTVERIQPSQLGKIKEYLLHQGWVPSEWNYSKKTKERTGPRLTDRKTKEPCPNLKRLDIDWIGLLSEYIQAQSRLSLLRGKTGATGLLVKCHEGVIGSDADTCGTPTARFKHRGIVNIPRSSSFLGKEFRSLFKAREGYQMVGWDASGLEARMEAHNVYPIDEAYASTLVEGDSSKGTDIHTLNWERLGLKDRDDAKTFKYAITYGARPAKLASSLGVTKTVAEKWYRDFWEVNWGLEALVEQLTTEWRLLGKKYLQGLDGRLITTRKPSALLNSKLQSDGAIVMKHAMIIANGLIRKRFTREEAHGLIRMHDEEQWECLPEFSEEIGLIGVDSIVRAGEYLDLRVPLDGEYSIGNNWSETH
jgi:hypothetical protein